MPVVRLSDSEDRVELIHVVQMFGDPINNRRPAFSKNGLVITLKF